MIILFVENTSSQELSLLRLLQFVCVYSNFSSDLDLEIIKQGPLVRKTSLLGTKKQLWAVLTQNYLYVFKDENDDHPLEIVFIEGCFIEPLDEDDDLFGFEVIKDVERSRKEVFYAPSAALRVEWIKELRMAAHTFPVTEKYRFGKKIGVGKFAVVYEAWSLENGKLLLLSFLSD